MTDVARPFQLQDWKGRAFFVLGCRMKFLFPQVQLHTMHRYRRPLCSWLNCYDLHIVCAPECIEKTKFIIKGELP